MDFSDYSTNVLSSNNFAVIHYEYLEIQPGQRVNPRKDLHRLESSLRLEGRLVHCDPSRDGIWSFTPTDTVEKSGSTPSLSARGESLGIRLSEKERGTYEPSNLAKGKQVTTSSFGTPGSTLSPSTTLDGSLRNAQTINAWATQQNTSNAPIIEQPIPSPGSRTSTGLTDQISVQKHIHECIVSAVLGAVVHQLCRNSGFLPLNSRTLILSPPNAAGSNSYAQKMSAEVSEIMIATLDVSLTSLGILIVKAQSDFVPYLQNLSQDSPKPAELKPTHGVPLWLAPGGIAARYYGPLEEDYALHANLRNSDLQGIPPDYRHPATSPAQIQLWKSRCLEWLAEKGLRIESLESGNWVFVQVFNGEMLYPGPGHYETSIADDSSIVPWPASLCFQASASPNTQHSWPNPLTTQPRDPLYFAEGWFSGKDERAAAMSKRQIERKAVEISSKEQADMESKAVQFHASSPVALRRSSNAGAVYPTPPDALHHPFGATPSFDGNVSTPGNSNAYAQHEGGFNASSQPPPRTNAEMWNPSERKDRPPASDVFNDNDNLFGEIDGDFFGTDVTDADFSFFDQPDESPHQENSNPSVADGHVFPEANSPGGEMEFTMETSLSPDVEMELGGSSVTNNNEVQVAVDCLPPPPPDEEAISLTNDNNEPPSTEKPLRLPSASPPFDKNIVFKRLIQASARKEAPKQSRRPSSFNKIEFQESLTCVNEKYNETGQYSFLAQKRQRPFQQPVVSNLPRTDYLQRHQVAHHSKEQRYPFPDPVEQFTSAARQSDSIDLITDSDASSQISDQEDSSNSTRTLDPHAYLNTKNIWTHGTSDSVMMPSPLDNNFPAESENGAQTPRSISDPQSLFLDPDPADWPLTSYFISPYPEADPVGLSDFERIATAQILADQAVSGTLQVPGCSMLELPYDAKRKSNLKRSLQGLVQAIKECLTLLATCTVRSYLDIPGIPAIQGLRMPPRPMPQPRGLSTLELSKSSNPFMIPSPRLELRRAELKISVLPSAVNFWDNLGLGPSTGSKDVAAVCVYPNVEGVALFANTFLDQMRSLYETFRLGTHERLITKDLTYGLLPYTAVDPAQQEDNRFVAALKETVGRLGRVFASHPVEEKNLVVYFFYPLDDAQLLVHVCSAFQFLFTMYRKALSEKKMSTVNELVLQLVPLNFISSSSSLVVPTSSQYSRLAMEVYDRCVDFNSSSSSPAILLEQPLPKTIDFKLSVNPSAALLQENTCLHIAYAQSIDDRWVTAAWTDNKGAQQMTASYCLGRKNQPISMSFADIANEIWATTLDYTASKKIYWRVIIVRAGVMELTEVETWTNLAATRSDSNVSMTLVAARTDPSLRLLPNPTTLFPNAAPTQSVLTPASTPQPTQTTFGSQDTVSTPTKESQNAPTPGEAPAEPDKDAYLVDYTDQTWGAVLSHRLNISNSLLELNPALISGYLIKRGGTNLEDPPILMEVNIVHSDVVGNPRTFHESLLREILGHYRGLGTLARVRGIIDPVVDCRPWHIAAAEKAVKALYMLM